MGKFKTGDLVIIHKPFTVEGIPRWSSGMDVLDNIRVKIDRNVNDVYSVLLQNPSTGLYTSTCCHVLKESWLSPTNYESADIENFLKRSET